jgi:5-methylcytosine-specific restriction endonuclease McrA
MPGKSGSRGLYDTPEWRALAKKVLKRDLRCRGRCGGYNKSSIADHVVAVRDGGAKLDPANVVGLCHPCHRLKSRNEQGLRGDLPGGAVTQRTALVKGSDASGTPLDPGHHWNRADG